MNATLYTLLNNVATNHTGLANCGDGSGDCQTGIPRVDASNVQLGQILQIIFGTFAALAVLMIVIAGLRFVTAQGDTADIAKARKTIIYAAAGLLIALTAEGIVTFVVGRYP